MSWLLYSIQDFQGKCIFRVYEDVSMPIIKVNTFSKPFYIHMLNPETIMVIAAIMCRRRTNGILLAVAPPVNTSPIPLLGVRVTELSVLLNAMLVEPTKRSPLGASETAVPSTVTADPPGETVSPLVKVNPDGLGVMMFPAIVMTPAAVLLSKVRVLEPIARCPDTPREILVPSMTCPTPPGRSVVPS